MQRYDPDCLLQSLTAEGGADDGETAPPAVEEVVLESEDVPQDEEMKPIESQPPQLLKVLCRFEHAAPGDAAGATGLDCQLCCAPGLPR